MRYLSEGNYEEAIIAFEAAIKIDPKRPEAYLQEAYAYVGMGDLEAAKAILERGYGRTKDEGLLKKLKEFENGQCLPLNAYGATEFTWRENYYTFSELTSEQQRLIETIGNAAINNDTDTLYGLLDMPGIEGFTPDHGYTIWNGYKVSLRFYPYEIDGEGDMSGSIDITLRSENGMGYAYGVNSSSAVSTAGRNDWHDYYYFEKRKTCLCTDWQWNGDLTGAEKLRSQLRSANGYTCESIEEITESGKMVNSQPDGIWTTNEHEVNNWEPYDTTCTMVFEQGVLVEVDNMNDIDIGRIGILDVSFASTLIFVAPADWSNFCDEVYW